VLPLLSETGPINVPLICTCKKALVYLSNPEQSKVDFGPVIYGEQCTKWVKLKNEGALNAKVFVKTPDGRQIPVINQDELNRRIEEQSKKEQSMVVDNAEMAIDPNEHINANDIAAQEDAEFDKQLPEEVQRQIDEQAASRRASLLK
jgi:hypothetical protein